MTGLAILTIILLGLSAVIGYWATERSKDKSFVSWTQFMIALATAGTVISAYAKAQDQIGIRTASYTVDTVVTTTTVNDVVSSDTTYVIHFTRK